MPVATTTTVPTDTVYFVSPGSVSYTIPVSTSYGTVSTVTFTAKELAATATSTSSPSPSFIITTEAVKKKYEELLGAAERYATTESPAYVEYTWRGEKVSREEFDRRMGGGTEVASPRPPTEESPENLREFQW